MTIDDLIIEAAASKDRFWFVQTVRIVERTDFTVTIRFLISADLFVQVFFSQRSGRFNLALVGTTGRLYGRDREHGSWHLHPFGRPEQHQPTPEGMSAQPVAQFLSEVEEILLENDLI
ncbi:hypothetical protein D6833_12970 [Candidatus Parcubacteria bacterium]|nr:MAG: hypothetical protein D6833_12970 [Candidatus Parcubacteria bacterium]